jgi:hypothetical protein
MPGATVHTVLKAKLSTGAFGLVYSSAHCSAREELRCAYRPCLRWRQSVFLCSLRRLRAKALPMMEGQVTLVLKRTDVWLIEAHRYTLKSPAPPTTPAPLAKRPGGDAG